MKIRNGFVSNSSSTSFCIVGIDINPYYEKEKHPIKEALKNILTDNGKKDMWDYDEHWGGWLDLGDGLSAYGYGEGFEYIGIDLVENFKRGMTYGEMKTAFIEIVKEKYNIDIPKDLIIAEHGEASSE